MLQGQSGQILRLIATHPEVDAVTRKIANQWGLKYVDSTWYINNPEIPIDPSHIDLLITPNSEYAYQVELSGAIVGAKSLHIDFNKGKSAYRIKHGGGRNQAIAKAVGIKPKFKPSIIDATAGLAQDAFVLAHLGCHVQLLERSPIVALLIQDGIRRAQLNSSISDWVNERITLHYGNSIDILSSQPHQADVIYLDPMYPHRSKSALVKKEMRILRALVGNDVDANTLLSAAFPAAKKRVVVKRPKGAPELISNQIPRNHTIETKSTRYDVYMVS